ncbi:MAG: cytochrome c family protein [Verrucomicrobiales bacterium]|nr:cytochrome c family protein [Verrucomicrobiales bacterium]
MSDIFPRWTNRLPLKVAIGALLVASAATAGINYYFTPKYANIGYQPHQPVAFSHNIHATQLGIDCRYCHNGVEKSWYSNVPTSSTCMNCHNQVLKDDDKLALVRESAATGQPIPWIQIHKLPDYVYFNHSVHVNRGVSCVKCHGQVNHLDEVKQVKSLTMSFCLECHRDPSKHLRENKDVFNLDLVISPEEQEKKGTEFVKNWHVNASQNCSACHR